MEPRILLGQLKETPEKLIDAVTLRMLVNFLNLKYFFLKEF